MNRLVRVLTWMAGILVSLFFLSIALLYLEATGGHDGWLCEWGIDTDGAGTVVSGCG